MRFDIAKVSNSILVVLAPLVVYLSTSDFLDLFNQTYSTSSIAIVQFFQQSLELVS